MGGNLFVWILIGLLVGVAGRLLLPARDPGGFVVTILLGIAGALLAGFCAHAIGFAQIDTLGASVAAAIGAVVLLIAYWLVMRSRTG